MSQENIEVIERAVAALNERDVDGYLACCTDDIQLRTPWAAVEGVYEGSQAIRRFFADLRDTALDFRLTIERADPIGANRVLVFLRATGSGRASGIPAGGMAGGVNDPSAATEVPTANIYDFVGGKIASIRIFVDRAEALEAVGLQEYAMSQENVEDIVRSIYSKWQRGNFADVRFFDPEVVFESVMPDSSERVVAHGPEGVEAFMREFLSQWRDYRVSGRDFRQVGTKTVLVEGHQAGTGRRSGVAVESPMFSVWTFRNGKVVRLIMEFDRSKALKAAGLRE